MGSRDQIFVPPPTKWPLRFQVVNDSLENAADLDNAFTSFGDAFAFLKGQPASLNPWNNVVWTGEVSAGMYPEKVWIPNTVFLHSPNPLSVYITGGSSVLAGEPIVSVANGGLRNFLIQPIGSSGTPLASLLIRDSAYLYSDEDYTWVGSLTGKTLIFLNPSGVTITFTGAETDAPSVAAKITADGSGVVSAIALANRVIIIPTVVTTLTIDRDGTANPVLGFFTDFDLSSITNAVEFMLAQNLVVGALPTQEKAIWFTDRGGGQYVIDGLTVGGAKNGIYIEDNAQAIIRSGFPFFNSVYGIYVGDDAILELEGGRSVQNTTKDIWIQPTGKVFARGNFAYDTRGGSGELISSGARDSLNFSVAGTIAIGNLDGTRLADYEMIIETVTLAREIAGNSGETIIQLVEIEPGGATTDLYIGTPQPEVTAAQGDFAFVEAALPDQLVISKGNGLIVNVTQKEVGLPKGLTVKVRVSVTSGAGV